jgi:hypothetical protein
MYHIQGEGTGVAVNAPTLGISVAWLHELLAIEMGTVGDDAVHVLPKVVLER